MSLPLDVSQPLFLLVLKTLTTFFCVAYLKDFYFVLLAKFG